jgi:hypothetical protein
MFRREKDDSTHFLLAVYRGQTKKSVQCTSYLPAGEYVLEISSSYLNTC